MKTGYRIFLKNRSPWIVLAVIFIVIFVVRFNDVNKYLTPPSEDLGGDLNVLNAYVTPNAVRPYLRFESPPIYYFLVVLPSISVLPVFLGLKVYDALLPTLVAIPFFLLSKEIANDDFGAILATALFTFSEIYNEMMGWGGTLNLLGIFFMLFSAYFLLKTLKKLNLRDTILAGVFLSLVFGTHHLSAVYYSIVILFAATIVIAFKILPAKQMVKQLTVMLSVGGFLSLPYVGVYFFMVNNRVSIASTFLPLQWIASLPTLILSMSRSFPVTAVVILLGLSGFFCVWRYCSRSVLAVPAAFLLAAVCLSIVLNTETVDRASYFVPIAIFSVSAVFFSRVRSLINDKDTSRRLVAFVLLSVITLILFQGAYARLDGAITYYHIVDDDAASALNWVRDNTPRGTVIFTNYASLGTWIEGYSNRKALAPRATGFIVTRPDFEEALVGNDIDAGNYVIKNGYMLVSDYFPAGYDNPGIYVRRNSKYEPLIFLDDAHQSFSFSLRNDTDVRRSNLLSANKTMVEPFSEHDAVRITYQYSWNFGTAMRQVELSRKPKVLVTYDLAITDGNISEFNLTSIVYSVNQVKSHTINGTNVNLTIITEDGTEEIIRLSTNDSSNIWEVIYDDSMPSSIVFLLGQLTSRISITLELDLTSIDNLDSDVQFTNSINLLRDYSVSYLLLDKEKYSQWVRFTKGFKGLTYAFENERILILKMEN